MKFGIIGGGNLGITTAFALADKGSGAVWLQDMEEGRGEGKALDLAEASPLRHYDQPIKGTTNPADLMDSDIFIITAGQPRNEGQCRTDLLDTNIGIVKAIAENIKANATASSPTVIVATEPVDLMIEAVLQTTGFPREQVIGIGTLLTETRMRQKLAEELDLSSADIDAMVVGTHLDTKAVFLKRYSRISGLTLDLFLEDAKLDELFAEAAKGGTDVVETAKRFGSFYTPAAAIAEVAHAIATDANWLTTLSVHLEGEYGIEGVCVSVPVKLGNGGVKQLIQLKLADDERAALQASADYQKPLLSKIL